MVANREHALEQYQISQDFVAEGKLKKAIDCLTGCLDEFEAVGDKYWYCRTLNALGIAFDLSGSTDVAVDCFLRFLQYAREADIPGICHIFYNNIGNCYYELSAYKECLEYFKLAEKEVHKMDIENNSELRQWYLVTYCNLGSGYYNNKEYDNAMHYLLEAKRLQNELHIDGFTECIEVNLMKLHLALGDEDYIKEHMPDLLKAAREEKENPLDYVQNMKELLGLFKELKMYDEMYDTIVRFERLVNRNYNPKLLLTLTEHYMDYYETVGDTANYRNACVEHAEYVMSSKELINKERLNVLNNKIHVIKAQEEIELVRASRENDPVTHIKNRFAMTREGNQVLLNCAKENRKALIGILDIDCFKQYNDTYGHIKGDEVLQTVSLVLKDKLEGYGEAYRFGGDEFVIIISSANKRIGENVARSIQAGIEEKAIVNANSTVKPVLTITQGYVLREPKVDEHLERYLEFADTVLYDAKKQGRDGFLVREL